VFQLVSAFVSAFFFSHFASAPPPAISNTLAAAAAPGGPPMSTGVRNGEQNASSHLELERHHQAMHGRSSENQQDACR